MHRVCRFSPFSFALADNATGDSFDERWRNLERETGIEPATNSLEGCDSTTELLPPSRQPAAPHLRFADQLASERPLVPPTLLLTTRDSPSSALTSLHAARLGQSAPSTLVLSTQRASRSSR